MCATWSDTRWQPRSGQQPHHGFVGALHLLSEPYIEVDGNTATAETDLVIVAPSADGRLNIRAANRYYDRFRRAADGRWLYTERRVETRRPKPRRAG